MCSVDVIDVDITLRVEQLTDMCVFVDARFLSLSDRRRDWY